MRTARHRSVASPSLLSLALGCALSCGSIARTGDPPAPPSPPTRHALPQKAVGFYAVYLPPGYEKEAGKDRRYPVCIILHGRGSTELQHGSLANVLGRQDVIYLAPRAPYPMVGLMLEGQREGWTAWPPFPKEWGTFGEEGFRKEEVEPLDLPRLYTGWIADCLEDVRRRYRTDGGKAVVVGHSEGAMFAHRFALDHPDQVRAYIGHAGYYRDTILDGRCAETLKKHGILPVITHYEKDPLMPVQESRDLAAYLEKEGVKHEKLILPGGDHGFGSLTTRRAKEFVERLCRGKELPPLAGIVTVAAVEPGSVAAQAGLREGDEILSYDGVAPKSVDEAKQAISAAEGKADVTIAIRRGKEAVSLKARGGRLGVTLEDR